MASNDDIFKLLINNSKLLGITAQYVHDVITIVVSGVEKCGKCNVRLFTVQHDSGLKFCDRCSAETIVHATQRVARGGSDDFYASIMLENRWVDIQTSDASRRINALIDIDQEQLPPGIH